MHELSIALSLVDVAGEEADRVGPDVRVVALRLRLGRLSGVVKEALAFSFEVASQGTRVDGARLEIEEIPVAIRCAACGSESEIGAAHPLQCPACGLAAADVVRGRECLLVALEIDDDDATDR
jgi:hydrogenase nickel incorporation protein HypA/HybF